MGYFVWAKSSRYIVARLGQGQLVSSATEESYVIIKFTYFLRKKRCVYEHQVTLLVQSLI